MKLGLSPKLMVFWVSPPSPLSLTIMHFFAGFFLISPYVWPNSRFWVLWLSYFTDNSITYLHICKTKNLGINFDWTKRLKITQHQKEITHWIRHTWAEKLWIQQTHTMKKDNKLNFCCSINTEKYTRLCNAHKL
jgi:hypothetical protein